jgi:Mn2+/Fe2+ NRAMP family transporter
MSIDTHHDLLRHGSLNAVEAARDRTGTQDLLLKLVQIVVAVATFLELAATFTRWSTPAIVMIGTGVVALSIAVGLYAIRGRVRAVHGGRGTQAIIALLVGIFAISIALVVLGLVPPDWISSGSGETIQQLIFVSAGALAAASFVGAAWWGYRIAQRSKSIMTVLEDEQRALEARRLATEELLASLQTLLDSQAASAHGTRMHSVRSSDRREVQ